MAPPKDGAAVVCVLYIDEFGIGLAASFTELGRKEFAAGPPESVVSTSRADSIPNVTAIAILT